MHYLKNSRMDAMMYVFIKFLFFKLKINTTCTHAQVPWDSALEGHTPLDPMTATEVHKDMMHMTHTHAPRHTPINIHTRAHARARAHTHTRTHTYIDSYHIYMYVCVYASIYICRYAKISCEITFRWSTHSHTCTCTQIYRFISYSQISVYMYVCMYAKSSYMHERFQENAFRRITHTYKHIHTHRYTDI